MLLLLGGLVSVLGSALSPLPASSSEWWVIDVKVKKRKAGSAMSPLPVG